MLLKMRGIETLLSQFYPLKSTLASHKHLQLPVFTSQREVRSIVTELHQSLIGISKLLIFRDPIIAFTPPGRLD